MTDDKTTGPEYAEGGAMYVQTEPTHDQPAQMTVYTPEPTRFMDVCESCIDWGKTMIQFLVVGAVCVAVGWVVHDWWITQAAVEKRLGQMENVSVEHGRRLHDLEWRMVEYHGGPPQ